MPRFHADDFLSDVGRKKAADFLNGVDETLRDLIAANQQKLIEMGKAYAKPENFGY